MSIIRKAVCALVVLSVLAFQSVSHAETPEVKQAGQLSLAGSVVVDAKDRIGSFVTAITTPVINPKELQCLARNIFFEAASEPEEGKVAVGLVTLNRVQDGRFASSVCGVVDQRIVQNIPRQIVIEKRSMFRTIQETQTVYTQRAVCQFSWRCVMVRTPKGEDERWVESQRIARDLLAQDDVYSDFRSKYDGALYFHATSVRPQWAKQKQVIGRVGGHWFYQDSPARMAKAF